MKYPHSVPLWRTNEELLPGDIPSRVVLSSVSTRWNDVLLEQHRLPSSELADLTYQRHVVVINIGHSSTWEFKKEGQFRRFFKARGAISFFPSHQPFSGRLKVERGVFANVLFLALDPVFVRRVAEGLELDSDRSIELVEHSDEVPTLHFSTLLWHCGPESRAAMLLIVCMGRHYQQPSPFTSYANTARQCSGRKDSMVGCRAKSWCVLWNIFKIN